MNGDKVGKALAELAEAMRVEGLARVTYVGSNFSLEGREKLWATAKAREAFEAALKSFVERLVKA